MEKPTRESLLEKAQTILAGLVLGETSKGLCIVCGHDQSCWSGDPSAFQCGNCKQATVFEVTELVSLMGGGGAGPGEAQQR